MARFTPEEMKIKRDNLATLKKVFPYLNKSNSKLLTKGELEAITRRKEFNRTYIRDRAVINELFNKNDSRLVNGGFIFDDEGIE